jgi:hypothetical protein
VSNQLGALVATHLSDRRRSLLAWGIPLGLWSAFIVIIFPSVEEALSKAIQNYPAALKEAFGIGQLTSVVTGAVAGVLVSMYVIDLIGTVVAVVMAAIGAWLFERRDLSG